MADTTKSVAEKRPGFFASFWNDTKKIPRKTGKLQAIRIIGIVRVRTAHFSSIRIRQNMTKGSNMTNKKLTLVLLLLFLTAGPSLAQEARVTSLMSKDLTDIPGKEGLMISVEYPPGGSDPIHRHNAQAFVYVLEGSIVMQVKGGKEVTLTPGQTFYEGTDDVHVVGRNASTTKPAKFLVFLVKNKGAPVLVPVE